jgi:GTP-binding protein HflX
MKSSEITFDRERTLVIVVDDRQDKGWLAEDIADEMAELVRACRGEVVGVAFCRGDHPTAAYLIGRGKVDEIAGICQATDVKTVVFSQDLKGSQQRNLEDALHVKTIDRTQLILDIFARRAVSQEGKMQVELAQLEYLMPRLVGKGIALSRLGGGIGTSGPGETKLEVDRRRISQRISKLKHDLKELTADRAVKRKKRRDQGMPLISLVGYTNAGKSTLLNTLTNAAQLTQDGLFTTLDPLSRQCVLPNHQKVVLSDTVGFMHDLPHHLVESFMATLEEVIEADLLVHVVDASHVKYRMLYDSVRQVLRGLKVQDKPTLTVLNKIDLVADRDFLDDFTREFKHSVAISAKTQENLPRFLECLTEQLASLIMSIDVMLPINRMDLINIAHQQGQVFFVKYYNDRVHLRAALPHNLAGKFLKLSVHSA